MTTRPLNIRTPGGSVSALWHHPTDFKAALLLAHGAGAGMNHPFMAGISNELGRHGIATLRFNFPYMEARKRVPDRPPVLCDTIHAALEQMIAMADGVPVFIGGKSMGGRMSSTLVSQEPLPEVRGVLFFGFPLHPPEKPSVQRAEHLSLVKCPMLFIQGTRDNLAELKLLKPIITRLGALATLHIVDGADHSFRVLKSSGRTNENAFEEVVAVAAKWLLSQK